MAEKLFLKDLFKDTETIYISQDHECTFSHDLTGATDFIQETGVETLIYAPCDLKLIYNRDIQSDLASTNTIMFQSVNDVEFTDGSVGKLCISFAHMSDTKYLAIGAQNWVKNQVFTKGSEIYYTGNYGGGSTGVHVHIRLAKGNFLSPAFLEVRGEPSQRFVLNTTGETPLTCDEVFFIDGMGITYNPSTTSADPKNYFWKYSSPLSGVRLKALNNSIQVLDKPGDGSVLTTVYLGGEADVLYFQPGFTKNSDNVMYQWAFVKYGNIEGFAKLDLKDDYLLERDGGASQVYMRAINLAFNIRTTKVSGTVLKTVPIKERAHLWNVESTLASDGYQWCQAEYDGRVGYAQMDTVGYYQLEGE